MMSTVEHRVDNGIMGNHALAHELGDERVRVLVRRILPRRTVQPERSHGGTWQRDITSIAKRSRKKRRAEGSHLEPDRHPVAIGGTIDGRRPSFRPADGEKGLAVKSGHHHLPMTGHNRQKLVSAFAPRGPDALDEWQIRRTILKRQEHVLPRRRTLLLGSARRVSLRLAALAASIPPGFPRARWSPRRSPEGQTRRARTRGPSARGSSPAAGPGGPCRDHLGSARLLSPDSRPGRPGIDMAPVARSETRRGRSSAPLATDALRGPRGRPPDAPARTRHRLDPRATAREGRPGSGHAPTRRQRRLGKVRAARGRVLRADRRHLKEMTKIAEGISLRSTLPLVDRGQVDLCPFRIDDELERVEVLIPRPKPVQGAASEIWQGAARRVVEEPQIHELQR